MNTQDETEENEIEELAKLAEMSLKKHMSTPPPGLVFDIDFIDKKHNFFR